MSPMWRSGVAFVERATITAVEADVAIAVPLSEPINLSEDGYGRLLAVVLRVIALSRTVNLITTTR
jgi:hypothetical protein